MSHDDHKQMKIFAATGGHQLAEKMCKHLELPLAEATVECFPDNEIIVKVTKMSEAGIVLLFNLPQCQLMTT